MKSKKCSATTEHQALVCAVCKIKSAISDSRSVLSTARSNKTPGYITLDKGLQATRCGKLLAWKLQRLHFLYKQLEVVYAVI